VHGAAVNEGFGLGEWLSEEEDKEALSLRPIIGALLVEHTELVWWLFDHEATLWHKHRWKAKASLSGLDSTFELWGYIEAEKSTCGEFLPWSRGVVERLGWCGAQRRG
jgi:hypothetical protein